ncbi:uncharacterized protein [Diadema antillarum]|uniref:uncharacterized protein n=1 Tax=Diadema antillarum TaxID=105358 RepID=UPI003A83AE76
MAGIQKNCKVTSLQYKNDYHLTIDHPMTESIVDRDYMRITVHPQPLLARNPSGRRNYFMPQCETEWIQMVNKLNDGQGTYHQSTTYVKPGVYPSRSISANSYFDPYALGSNSSLNITARTLNLSSRRQMQRAYERACRSTIRGDKSRASSASVRDLDSYGDRVNTPSLTTRLATMSSRAKSVCSERSSCSSSTTNTDFSSGHSSPEKPTYVLPRPPPVKMPKVAAMPSKREAWFSAPYRSRIVRQSPPWRSLLNRRPEGVRASGGLCPNHCRCCFEATYDTNNKNIYKVDQE